MLYSQGLMWCPHSMDVGCLRRNFCKFWKLTNCTSKVPKDDLQKLEELFCGSHQLARLRSLVLTISLLINRGLLMPRSPERTTTYICCGQSYRGSATAYTQSRIHHTRTGIRHIMEIYVADLLDNSSFHVHHCRLQEFIQERLQLQLDDADVKDLLLGCHALDCMLKQCVQALETFDAVLCQCESYFESFL